MGKAIKIAWPGGIGTFNIYVTSAEDNCKDAGIVRQPETILLPPYSVVTLNHKQLAAPVVVLAFICH